MPTPDYQALLAELSGWQQAHGVVPTVARYLPGPENEVDMLVPRGEQPHPVAVLLHGGFWRAAYGRSIMGAMAHDLALRGWVTWNVEYRRIGSGGGPAHSQSDVRNAIEALASYRGPLDVDRIVLIGHSAGGQLALCAARLRGVVAVVSLAGVCDMATGARLGIGDNAVSEFLGGATPDQQPDVYELADPMARIPTGVRTLLVHGDADDRVPVELSRNYAAAAQAAGDSCELMELPGVDHFALIDPRTSAWAAVAERLPGLREGTG